MAHKYLLTNSHLVQTKYYGFVRLDCGGGGRLVSHALGASGHYNGILGPLGISLLSGAHEICSINFVLPVIMKNVTFEKSNFYVIFLHESLTPSKIRFLAGPPLKIHFFTDWHLVYSGYSTSTYSTIAWLYKLGQWPIRYELFGQP